MGRTVLSRELNQYSPEEKWLHNSPDHIWRRISKMRLFAVHSADTINSNGLKQKKENRCKFQEAVYKNTKWALAQLLFIMHNIRDKPPWQDYQVTVYGCYKHQTRHLRGLCAVGVLVCHCRVGGEMVSICWSKVIWASLSKTKVQIRMGFVPLFVLWV